MNERRCVRICMDKISRDSDTKAKREGRFGSLLLLRARAAARSATNPYRCRFFGATFCLWSGSTTTVVAHSCAWVRKEIVPHLHKDAVSEVGGQCSVRKRGETVVKLRRFSAFPGRIWAASARPSANPFSIAISTCSAFLTRCSALRSPPLLSSTRHPSNNVTPVEDDARLCEWRVVASPPSRPLPAPAPLGGVRAAVAAPAAAASSGVRRMLQGSKRRGSLTL